MPDGIRERRFAGRFSRARRRSSRSGRSAGAAGLGSRDPPPRGTITSISQVLRVVTENRPGTESTVSRARERAGLDGHATRAEPGSFGKSPSFPQFLGHLRPRPHAPASESIAAMGNAGRPPIPLRRNQEEEKRKSASCPAAGQDGRWRRQPTRETNRETIDAMTLLLHAPLRKRSGRLIPPGLGGPALGRRFPLSHRKKLRQACRATSFHVPSGHPATGGNDMRRTRFAQAFAPATPGRCGRAPPEQAPAPALAVAQVAAAERFSRGMTASRSHPPESASEFGRRVSRSCRRPRPVNGEAPGRRRYGDDGQHGRFRPNEA